MRRLIAVVVVALVAGTTALASPAAARPGTPQFLGYDNPQLNTGTTQCDFVTGVSYSAGGGYQFMIMISDGTTSLGSQTYRLRPGDPGHISVSLPVQDGATVTSMYLWIWNHDTVVTLDVSSPVGGPFFCSLN